MTAGDGGKALLHRQMLPGAGIRDKNPMHGDGDGGEAMGGGVDCCR